KVLVSRIHSLTTGIEIRLVRFGAYRRPTMAPIIRSSPALAFLVLQFSLIFFSSTLPYSSGSEDTYTITGRVKIPPSNVIGHLSKLSNVKVILNGGQCVTFLRPDGYFTLYPLFNILSQSACWDSFGRSICNGLLLFSGKFLVLCVRVDVSARHHGKVHATLTETRRSLTELVLEPLREEQYYEIREPFSILSIVKSPMGLMVGFMVVVVFLMPKLMENIDPEEMKQAQEEMRRQGVPSLSSLLPSAGASR
ncbi:hypothetical protein HID58_082880, partial [Brassica napus]